jgi:hypothetical protein
MQKLQNVGCDSSDAGRKHWIEQSISQPDEREMNYLQIRVHLVVK